MVSLTGAELAFAFGVLLAAGTVRGIIGFGLPLLSTPFLILVLPPKTVIPAFVIPLLATNLQIIVHDGLPRSFLRAEGPLLVTTAVGTVLGVVALAASSPQLIFLVVSAYVGVYLLLSNASRIVEANADRRGAGAVVGLVSGVLGGLVSLQGVVLITYLHARNLDKRTFVTAAAAILFLGVGMRVPPMIATGLLGIDEALLGLGILIPAAVGTYLGARARPFVPQAVFERVIEALLAFIAVRLALDGLGIQVGPLL